MNRKNRQEIIKILDKHDIWEHVAMNYIAHMVQHELAFRKNNLPDHRDRRWKITEQLNHVLDDVMDLTAESRSQ